MLFVWFLFKYNTRMPVKKENTPPSELHQKSCFNNGVCNWVKHANETLK